MNAFKQVLRHQRGIGLVTAIMLLVGLAGLGAAMISIMSSTAISSALDVNGTRAYLAAKAGAEWGVFRARREGSCVGSTSFVLPNEMSSFTVTVTCEPYTVQDGNGTDINRFRVRSTSCNLAVGSCPTVTNNPDYVQRVVEVQFGE